MAGLHTPARIIIRTGLAVALAAPLLPACSAAGLHGVLPRTVFASKKKDAPNPDRSQVRATVQPAITIPAEPLGFSPPGSFYLGMRFSMVSLDFLDEDRLLFTFRVPGLMHRSGRREDAEGERQIRAVVLRLPQGAVEAETLWTLHDRARYLYPLGHGEFLLRDKDTLQIADSSLQSRPYLRFPGPLLWVEIDPSGRYLVTGSSEPPAQASKPGAVPSPLTANASVTDDSPNPLPGNDWVLRVLRRNDGKVMLVSHVHNAVHVPINADGYVELLRSKGTAWGLNFNYFTGGSTLIGSVDSACSPLLNFISPAAILASGCTSSGDPRLVAMGINGRRLWENNSSPPGVWPQLVKNASGTRIARESLLAGRSINAMAPIEPDDVKGQDVQVLDTATGKQVLRAAASPIFDGGGNVAISPSGRRVAILMGDSLQIFDLPEPPPLPDLSLQNDRLTTAK